jgi:hypothetical protein
MSVQTKPSVWNIGLDAWIIQDGNDQSKIALEKVQSTNAWKDDKGHASHILECELPPVPAVRPLNRAT